MITEIKTSFFPTKEESCSDCGNLIIIHDCRIGDRVCNRCGVVQVENDINK